MNGSFRLYQYMSALSALFSMVASGLNYGWPSTSIPQYTSGNSTLFRITEEEASWIIVAELIASIPACFLAVVIDNVYGHKKAILSTAFLYTSGWLLIVFGKSAIALLIARICAGISDGVVFTVLSLYLAEIADPDIRGLFCSGMSVMWMFGILIMNVFSSFLSITMTATISLTVPVLFFLTFVWMPESPYCLLMKNDTKGAVSSLKKLHRTDNIDHELKRLQNVVKNQNKKGGSFLELFTKRSNQKSLGIIVIVRNSQQMSGVIAITFYNLTIFKEAGDFISPFAATILYTSIQVVMVAVCSSIIDKIGRRPLLITSLIGSFICLFIEGCYFYLKERTDIDTNSFNYVSVIALIGYVVVFNLGAQPIPLLMQGELFPTNVKCLASCLGDVYYYTLAFIISKFFQSVHVAVGMFVPFLIFSCCCAFNLVFVVFFMPETKGKTLEEIQDWLCS